MKHGSLCGWTAFNVFYWLVSSISFFQQMRIQCFRSRQEPTKLYLQRVSYWSDGNHPVFYGIYLFTTAGATCINTALGTAMLSIFIWTPSKSIKKLHYILHAILFIFNKKVETQWVWGFVLCITCNVRIYPWVAQSAFHGVYINLMVEQNQSVWHFNNGQCCSYYIFYIMPLSWEVWPFYHCFLAWFVALMIWI